MEQKLKQDIQIGETIRSLRMEPVSYTHLTLPTIA